MSSTRIIGIGRALRALARARAGNIAMMMALAMVPMALAVGVGADYARTMKARSEVQNVIDGATLMGAGALSSKTDAEIVAAVKTWAARTYDISYGVLVVDDVTIDRTNLKVTTSARLAVPTTFGGLVGLTSIDSTVTSTAVAPSRPYMNI